MALKGDVIEPIKCSQWLDYGFNGFASFSNKLT